MCPIPSIITPYSFFPCVIASSKSPKKKISSLFCFAVFSRLSYPRILNDLLRLRSFQVESLHVFFLFTSVQILEKMPTIQGTKIKVIQKYSCVLFWNNSLGCDQSYTRARNKKGSFKTKLAGTQRADNTLKKVGTKAKQKKNRLYSSYSSSFSSSIKQLSVQP